MKNLFQKNNRFGKLAASVFWAIVVGALIIGAAIYFAPQNTIVQPQPPSQPKTDLAGTSTAPAVVATATAQCLAPAEALVTKIIDGDTIVVEGGYHVRILSIDADEKNHPCYEAASKRLEELVLNKKVILEKDISDVDQYKRCLRYIFWDKQNIGLELVKEGLVIARFYEPDVKYKAEIVLAEKTAIENKTGCKWAEVKSPQ